MDPTESDEFWRLEQTPPDMARKLVDFAEIPSGTSVLEPFAGLNNVYDLLEPGTRHRCEIRDGLDYREFTGDVDHIVTNPPYRVWDPVKQKRVNSFWPILEWCTGVARRSITLLINCKSFEGLTPIRLNKLGETHWVVTQLAVVRTKTWFGNYYMVKLEKNGLAILSGM